MRVGVAFALGLLLGGGCSGKALILDRSIPAVEAGDYTLAVSACENVPGHGMDICRVQEGDAIQSAWTMVIPTKGQAILGWEADVYYRDVVQPVSVSGVGPAIQIPWKDFFKQDTWTKALDGEAMALVTVRYRTPEGLEELVRFKGLAKIVVLSAGYDRLPLDSGFTAWGTTCKVQYSTAGRGALQCK